MEIENSSWKLRISDGNQDLRGGNCEFQMEIGNFKWKLRFSQWKSRISPGNRDFHEKDTTDANLLQAVKQIFRRAAPIFTTPEHFPPKFLNPHPRRFNSAACLKLK